MVIFQISIWNHHRLMVLTLLTGDPSVLDNPCSKLVCRSWHRDGRWARGTWSQSGYCTLQHPPSHWASASCFPSNVTPLSSCSQCPLTHTHTHRREMIDWSCDRCYWSENVLIIRQQPQHSSWSSCCVFNHFSWWVTNTQGHINRGETNPNDEKPEQSFQLGYKQKTRQLKRTHWPSWWLTRNKNIGCQVVNILCSLLSEQLISLSLWSTDGGRKRGQKHLIWLVRAILLPR